MSAFQVQELSEGHREWAASLLEEHWGSASVVSRGRIHDADVLPAFVATREEEPIGLVTYRIDGDECEITTLNSLVEGVGVGSALVAAVKGAAGSASCKRLWLITTNDNLPALRFYQKKGFSLVAVHRDALRESRRLKPEISLAGRDGIPLRDEIELEMIL